LTTQTSSGAGAVLVRQEGEEFKFEIKMVFATTNNEAKYEAVLANLGLTQEIGAKNLEARSNSQVVVNHVQGEYEACRDKMRRYLNKVQEYRAFFDIMVITRIPREENTWADSLVRVGSKLFKRSMPYADCILTFRASFLFSGISPFFRY
jgi:ribonuclease HI